LLPHADLGAIEEHIAKRDPHIHGDSVDDRLIFERSFLLDEPGDRPLAYGRADEPPF